MPLPPMPPMSSSYGSNGVSTTPPSMNEARAQGSDLAYRQQQLMQQIETLASQIQSLSLIAPFAQDDLLMSLSGLQSAREKILTQLGAEIEQVQANNSMAMPSQGSSVPDNSYQA